MKYTVRYIIGDVMGEVVLNVPDIKTSGKAYERDLARFIKRVDKLNSNFRKHKAKVEWSFEE